MPAKLIEEILNANKKRARAFHNEKPKRKKRRRKYPTEIAATMCMDGRISLAHITGLLVGIITPLRNIGGRYDLGWPLTRATLNEWESYCNGKRRPALLIVTYHWSKGDRHRGCAGFKYDTESARESAQAFRDQVNRAYRGRIYGILIGIETDENAMVLHSEDVQEMMCLANYNNLPSTKTLTHALASLYPNLPPQIVHDMIPLVRGNIRHVLTNRKNGRLIEELHHGENILAVGQGFGWLTLNSALIVGPCDPDLGQAIVTAAKIIRDNLKSGRISPNGGILLVSTPFRHDYDQAGAEEQSKFLVEFALRHIRAELPDMAKFFHVLAGTFDYDTQEFHPCLIS